MEISIRIAKDDDLKEYTDLLQRAYQDAYTDESIGLTRDQFSKEVFNSEDTQNYLKSQLEVDDKQKTWLAFLDKEMVGAITLKDKNEECELTGFYVAPEHQGKGIGKMLWQLALKESKGKDIILDTYIHNRRTIDLYKKWGFKVDEEKGIFYRHWPEWPEGLQAECLYMRLVQRR